MHRRGASVLPFPARLRQRHCNLSPSGHGVADHLPVPRLEDMQRQHGPWEQDHAGKGEDRNPLQGVGHLAGAAVVLDYSPAAARLLHRFFFRSADLTAA